MKIVLALTLVCFVEICELSGVFGGNTTAKKKRRDAGEILPESNCGPYCDNYELLQECINPCIQLTKYPDIKIPIGETPYSKSAKADPTPAKCVPVCTTLYTVDLLEKCLQICKSIDEAITAGTVHDHLPGECYIVCFV